MTGEGGPEIIAWWQRHIEELGLSLGMAFGGAGLTVWLGGDAVDRRKALKIIFAALFVDAATVSITQGYLGWSPFLAVPVGLVAGIVGLPVVMIAIRGSRRAENRAEDIADKGIDLLPGRKGDGQ